MNDKAFFDTNVLVYLVGEQDERMGPAEALIAGDSMVSVQALNALAAVARRKLGMTWEETAGALAAIRVLCPVACAAHD
jgi:predicted nucleic acid-binding protein